jgi:predicted signal transduction protein with EAL and GGDEF domain
VTATPRGSDRPRAHASGDGGGVGSIGGKVAERIITSLTKTFTIEGRTVLIGASVGVAELADHHSASTLLSDADVAMYCAKRSGRGRWILFEPRMHHEVADQLSLRTDLQQAESAGQLWVAYQPIVALATGQVEGVEALIRWDHPARGQIPPRTSSRWRRRVTRSPASGRS